MVSGRQTIEGDGLRPKDILPSTLDPRPSTMSPRAAYIHVPFCRHRCGYCNFTVVAGRDDLVEPYLDALERELRWLDSPREVDTLFLGGGTPTRRPPTQPRS